MAKRIVLQYFFVLLAINGLQSSVFNRESLGMVSQLLRKDSRDPLIVFVDSSKKIRSFDEDMGGESNSAGEVDTSGEYAVDNEKVKQNYDAVLYKVLRTSNIITDASGDKKPSSYHSYDRRIERKREEIEEAIRERCQARVECTEKCSRENALRERYCPKSCKAVFDYLVKCPPTRFEKKHNPPPPKDSCSSDSCASKNSCDGDACKSTKDSCDGDSCRSKDSCDGDSCKSKDSCGDSDSCNPTTSKRPYGKTFPPRRWTNNKYD